MQLLERHAQLAELEAARWDAASGRGGVVVVSGKAGMGKTALVRQFASGSAGEFRVLWGACEDLLFPRPLSPFCAMFPWLEPDRDPRRQSSPLSVSSGSVPARATDVADRVIAELDRPPHQTVAVVEDLQWADSATLEVTRIVVDRILEMSAMLVLTYRSDEVGPTHPLHAVLAAVPRPAVRMLQLEPLSRGALERLAGAVDARELYQLTGGVPFYVAETLQAPDGQPPVTAQDAVLARIAHLPAAAHACVEITSAVPGRAERWLLDGCDVSRGVDDAVRLGVLDADDDAVWFRHQLTRHAVEQSLHESRRRGINGRVLDALVGHDVDPERLVHHAVHAGNAAVVAKYAPVAAKRAGAMGCHHEAASHLEQALMHADYFSAEELAGVLEDYGRECELIAAYEAAHEAMAQAVEVRQTVVDRTGVGRGQGRLAGIEWRLGRGPEARLAAIRAVMTLEGVPQGAELIRAYVRLAVLAALDYRSDEAAHWSKRAVELAVQVNDDVGAAEAEVASTCARWRELTTEEPSLRVRLASASGAGAEQVTAWGYACLADRFLHEMLYDEAHALILDGVAHCGQYGLTEERDHLVALRACWYLERGDWLRAEQDAWRVLDTAHGVPARLHAQRVWLLLCARRGNPSGPVRMADARRLAEQGDEAHTRVPVGLAEAELGWFGDNRGSVLDAALSMFHRAREHGSGRWVGEAALWMRRVDAPVDAADDTAEPYTLQLTGRWSDAAGRWAELGRPYEQADALSDAPHRERSALRQALDTFDGLGATARADRLRRRLGGGPR